MDEVETKKVADKPSGQETDLGSRDKQEGNMGLGFSSFSDILKLNKVEVAGKKEGNGTLVCDDNSCRIVYGEDGKGEKISSSDSTSQKSPGDQLDRHKLPDGNSLLEMLKIDGKGKLEERRPENDLPKISVLPGFDSRNLPEVGNGGNRGPAFQFPVRPDITGNKIGNFYERGGPQGEIGERFRNFLSRPEVQNRIGAVLNDPEVKRGIMDVVQVVGQEMGIGLDAERGAINLNMDFASLYDRSVPRDSPDYNPEVRKMLEGLKNVNLTADKVTMKFDGEQMMKLSDKGIAAQYKIAFGAKDGGETSMSIDTTENTLSMKDIEGLQVVERSGRRLSVHQINLDSSDPKNPGGTITMDNPLPKPSFWPGNLPWSDTVTVPLLVPEAEKAQLAEKLPSAIKTIDAIRAGAKSGDITQTMSKVSMADFVSMLGWGLKNKGTIDFQSSWRPPDLKSMNNPSGPNDGTGNRIPGGLNPGRVRY